MNLTTILLRHRRENKHKCSLKGLEKHPHLKFYTYPRDILPDLSDYLLLDIDGPELSEHDCDRGLFIIDASWRLAQIVRRKYSHLETRSLPSCARTAYPRRQTKCSDPDRGLATVEALYLAHHILKRPIEGLLDQYHWKSAFLEMNRLVNPE